MAWPLASPGHQQTWNWLCRINGSLSYKERFQLRAQSQCWMIIEKLKYMFMFPKIDSAGQKFIKRLIYHPSSKTFSVTWPQVKNRLNKVICINQTGRCGKDTLMNWWSSGWNLTHPHPPLDKMAAISQTIYLDAFSWMEIFVSWLKFHRGLFLTIQLKINQHWCR